MDLNLQFRNKVSTHTRNTQNCQPNDGNAMATTTITATKRKRKHTKNPISHDTGVSWCVSILLFIALASINMVKCMKYETTAKTLQLRTKIVLNCYRKRFCWLLAGRARASNARITDVLMQQTLNAHHGKYTTSIQLKSCFAQFQYGSICLWCNVCTNVIGGRRTCSSIKSHNFPASSQTWSSRWWLI